METTKILNLSEEEFYNKFKPQKNHIDKNAGFDGCMFETYGVELDYVFKKSNEGLVVTIIEGVNEEREESFIDSIGVEIKETISTLYYASGFHYVNRLGFFVLEKSYEYEFEVKVE
jgi:CYTH domain-containing protein